MSESISITRGLAELKLLENKINKAIESDSFIILRKGDESPKGFKSVSEFETFVKAKQQKILDLKTRFRTIKSKIILSNAITKVKINDVEMTVAEAIEYKNSIKFDKNHFQIIRSQYNNVYNDLESKNENVQYRLDQLIEINLGKDSKAKSDEYESIAKPFMKRNEWKITDPIDIKSVCEKLQKQIDTFELEVDFVLSESNAKTEITLN